MQSSGKVSLLSLRVYYNFYGLITFIVLLKPDLTIKQTGLKLWAKLIYKIIWVKFYKCETQKQI